MADDRLRRDRFGVTPHYLDGVACHPARAQPKNTSTIGASWSAGVRWIDRGGIRVGRDRDQRGATVLTIGNRGRARPYSMADPQRRVREARFAAVSQGHVTRSACCHGGMTELGDAGLTEQGVTTVSGTDTTGRTAPREANRSTVLERCSQASSVDRGERSRDESQNGQAAKKSERGRPIALSL